MNTLKLNIPREQIEKAITETKTMAEAAARLKVRYSTFKRYAEKYGLWNPNQGGRGTRKSIPKDAVNLNEILLGQHPFYAPGALKRRIIKNNILDHTQCAICNHPNRWNGKELILQLDHIDGDRYNHKLENLRLICPNCHTQTSTFSCKNGSSYKPVYPNWQRDMA